MGKLIRWLTVFLANNELNYGKEAYEKWKKSESDELSSKYPHVMKNSIFKLNDVYETGAVLPEHMPNRKFKLLPQLEKELQEYLNVCQSTYSKSQCRNIKARCTCFMKFLQKRGLTGITALGYEDILAYHTEIPHKKRVDRMLYESSIKQFLAYLADKGKCSCGLGWFLHYLQSDRIPLIDAKENLADTLQLPNGVKSICLSAEEYLDLSEILLLTFKEEHLSKNHTAVYENAFRLHFIFLDRNGLDYSSERADVWAGAMKGVFKSSWPVVRRAMRLFDDYARTGVLSPGKAYPSAPHSFCRLPQWCQTPISEFVGQREKTKLAPSTTKMDMTACVRFCEFLSEEGLVSFKELTSAYYQRF